MIARNSFAIHRARCSAPLYYVEGSYFRPQTGKTYLLRLCWTEDDHTGYLRTYKDRFRTAINKYKVLLFIKVFCVFCFS